MPTKQTSPSRSIRAAAIAIISSAVQAPLMGGAPSCGQLGEAAVVFADVGGPPDVALHPCEEALAVAADRVPAHVELVVAVVVAVRVGGVRPAGGECDGVHGPAGDHDAAGPVLELRDDLLDGRD